MSTPSSAKTPELEAAIVPPDAATAGTPDPAGAAIEMAHPPASARRATMVIAAIAVVAVVAALALPRHRAGDTQSTSAPSLGRDSSTQSSATAPAASVSAAAPAASVAVVAEPISIDVAAPRPAAESRKKELVKPSARPSVSATTSSPTPASVVAPAPSEPAEPATADAGRAETETAPAPPPAAAAGLTPLTITGCLEINESEDRFRLTDTDGVNAPKARSWKTGFLKKRSASVNLVGVSDVPALAKEVGQRVAATGVLTDRDLKVSSVRVVSSHCD